MNTTKITLSGYHASAQRGGGLVLGTAGSRGNEQLHIVRGTGWEELTIKLIFHPCGVEIYLPQGDVAPVPWEATARPLPLHAGKLVFCGIAEGRVQITTDLEYTVCAHSPAQGDPAQAATASIWQQWIQSAGRVLEQATQYSQQLQQAEQARTAAEAARAQAAQTLDERCTAAVLRAEAAAQGLQNIVTLVDTEQGGDLDVVDEAGNVLVRFAAGGVYTQNFAGGTLSQQLGAGRALLVQNADFSAYALDVVRLLYPCSALALSQTELVFGSMNTQQLTATPTPSYTTDAITWTSTDPDVVSVENGAVTAHQNGTATITAACGSQSAACAVTVYVVPCTAIKVSNSMLTISSYTAKTITVTLTPTDTTEPVVWSSAKPTIAFVSGGTITPLKKGTATITATCGSCSANCAARVTASSPAAAYAFTPQRGFDGTAVQTNAARLLFSGTVSSVELANSTADGASYHPFMVPVGASQMQLTMPGAYGCAVGYFAVGQTAELLSWQTICTASDTCTLPLPAQPDSGGLGMVLELALQSGADVATDFDTSGFSIEFT